MAPASSSSSNRNQEAAILISSSSSDEDIDEGDVKFEESEEDEECESSESESQEDGDEEEVSLSEDEGGSSTDDDDDDEYDDAGEDDDVEGDCDGEEGKPIDEYYCNKVIGLLQGRKHLNVLKLEECKAYLRKNALRISGTKETCVKRILEHWRLKDGNGEMLYPRSSFVIDCTGDVCRGDVVFFVQRVYEKFDIAKRGGGGKIIGKRSIAGRVVKESYGSLKQQHTFTVEVLWSKGVKVLPLLFPLLVKGRNLYRMKTFRQPWSNEAVRSRILAEKHSRGRAARHVRATAKTLSANNGSKCKAKSFTTKTAPYMKKIQKLGSSAQRNHRRTREFVRTNAGLTAPKSHLKTRKAANTALPHFSATHTERFSYRPNGIHKERPNTWRNSHNNYNYSDNYMPTEVPRRISIGATHSHGSMHWRNSDNNYNYSDNYMLTEVPRRISIGATHSHGSMHHIPRYNMGYVPLAFGASHGHSSERDQVNNMSRYVSQHYRNPFI